jgi:hypothetical protein
MSKTSAGKHSQIIAVAVALTFGIGAFMFPNMTNSLLPVAYALNWHHAHLNVNLHQLLAQINQCVDNGTQCFNSGNNKVNIDLHHDWLNLIKLDQSLAQENDCSGGSTCINSGSNQANIHAHNHSGTSSTYVKVDQSLAQENDCSGGSTCINSGSNNANINIH